MNPIYLDNAATTQTDPRVLEAMLPYFTQDYGNASSIHRLGQKNNVAVEHARDSIAGILGTKPAHIIFTSGGTESNNAIIKGVLKATGKRKVITTPLEHHAVLHPLEHAAPEVTTRFLDVSKTGHISLEELEEAICADTALVTLMHVNNEVGTIHPISEIAEICSKKGVPFHSDTVQSVGKYELDLRNPAPDFISISAHKFHGPKGIGAMVIHPDAPWIPWMEGGSQERNRRGGTLNVPGIVGMAKALELAHASMIANREHLRQLKSLFMDGLQQRFGAAVTYNGDVSNGAPHIVNISFPRPENEALDGEMLLLNLDIEGVCCSNGSACTSGAVSASHVLLALGVPEKTAKSSIRFSFSKNNTAQEITITLDKLESVFRRMTDFG